jgi:hypothetical protein
MYSRAERMFILKYCFASKSFAAVRESFTNVYDDNEESTGNKFKVYIA